MAAQNQKKRLVEGFTIDGDKNTTQAATSTIIIIGLIFGIGLSFTFNNLLSFFENSSVNRGQLPEARPPFDYIQIMGTDIIGFLFVDLLEGISINQSMIFVRNLALGWFVGGFVSAIIFGRQGSKAPFSTIRLLARALMYPSFFAILYFSTYNLLSNLLGEIQEAPFIIVVILVFGVILVFFSLPLSILAYFGYRIGLAISG